MWQEIVNEDSIDRVSDGGVTFPVQEMVNQDADSSDTSQDGGVCRGKRNRIPHEMYVTVLHSKTYAKGKYKGVGFPTVRKKSTEGEELRNQFAGERYCTKRGVINLQSEWHRPDSNNDRRAARVSPGRSRDGSIVQHKESEGIVCRQG